MDGTRDKTGAIARLQPDGRWMVEAGNPIVRSSVKLYRNGMRMTQGFDYELDPLNPHYFRPLYPRPLWPWSWDASDIVVMDYLY